MDTGRSDLVEGNHEAAIQNLDEAIRLDPLFAVYYYNRGAAHYDLGRYMRSVDDYGGAIHMNPRFGDAYNGRGLAYYSLGGYGRAVEDYDEAIPLKDEIQGYIDLGDEPSRVSAPFYNRGLAYYELHLFDRALADLAEAIRLNPLGPDAYSMRAVAYTRIGNDVLAEQDMKRAVELGYDHSVPLEMVEQAK